MEKVCKICGWHLYKQINDCCVAIGVPEIAPVEEEDEVILEEEEAPEEVVEEEESDDDHDCCCEDLEAYLEALPVKELKKLCEEVDLSKKGKKADLVARLLE
jgi:hypothetical protein